ncbi:MAG TPA: hypothetical protein VFG51_03635 [Candidatus Saccharimonadia bacterium]|nr:hypothetical protein [Candidatus Saccharimonadia bacterium]
MKLARRICLSLAALVVLCVVFVGPAAQIVHAQNHAGEVSKINPFSFTPSRQQVVDTVSQDQQNGDYTQASYQLSSFTTFMGGAGIALMGASDSSGSPVAEGVIPQIGTAMAYMIQKPPASTEVWIADLMQNSPLLGEKAYAQGIGFQSLTPVLPIWKTFRDLSYIAFIFAFVVVGFMIMFRQKLNGQTVATISNALPKMVVTLLLITFSYAIAGFLIDLMYVSIYFICGVFANLTNQTAGQLANVALSQNIIWNGLRLIWNGNSSVAASAASQLGNIVQGFFDPKDKLGHDIGAVLGAGASVIGFLIFAIAIFFAVVKTFFELLKSYITFIILVIFSPFQLLIGMFKEGGDFAQWLKNLVATLVPFPVVIVMIFLAMALGGQGAPNVGFTQKIGDNAVGFQPPQLNIGSEHGAIDAVQGLLVIGIVMLIPEAVELSKKWLKASSPFDEFLPKISSNLQKGWKGGQLVDGIGPNIWGANKIVPGGLKSVGGGLVGAGIGAAAGGIGGGVLEYKNQRAAGVDRVGSLIPAVAVGGVGAVGGAGAGAVVGAAAPHYQTGKKIYETGNKAYNWSNEALKQARSYVDVTGGENRQKAKAAPVQGTQPNDLPPAR